MVRPANETAAAWAAILKNREPGWLSPGKPIFRAAKTASPTPAGDQGRIHPERLRRNPGPILIGTGSEVQYVVEAQKLLAEEDIAARVVSMPCREWFDEQDQLRRDSVIPSACLDRGRSRHRLA